MHISPNALHFTRTADHDGIVLPVATHAAHTQHDIFLRGRILDGPPRNDLQQAQDIQSSNGSS